MSCVVEGGGGPCGACKFLRRKCVKGCVFAPYFDSDQGATHFTAVHRVFRASNASKLLLRISPHRRLDAVVTLCYEALAKCITDSILSSPATPLFESSVHMKCDAKKLVAKRNVKAKRTAAYEGKKRMHCWQKSKQED
ncbi:hypothetical protein SASPL_112019 [Salvia splendens]|uniref:LOB domain-containing protein n=1 Tax=Salvia splendens TaxID=180675 RepID=A0A8X9A2X0_SALSN|nr:hypothetical protein SASPL_112019 [Salvia splendens]